MPACWGGRVCAVDGAVARGSPGALLHWHGSAGTPLRAEPLQPSAGCAQPEATPPRPHRTHTTGYGGARPAHDVRFPFAPSALRPHGRGRTTACEAPASRRPAAVPTPVVCPGGAHPLRHTRRAPAFGARGAGRRAERLPRAAPPVPGLLRPVEDGLARAWPARRQRCRGARAPASGPLRRS